MKDEKTAETQEKNHLSIGKVLMKQRSFNCAIQKYRRCFAIYERLIFDNIAVASVLIDSGRLDILGFAVQQFDLRSTKPFPLHDELNTWEEL